MTITNNADSNERGKYASLPDEFADDEEIVVKVQTPQEKVAEFIQIHRRDILKGIIATLVAAPIVYVAGKQGHDAVKNSDTEVGKAMRFQDTYERIKDMTVEISEMQKKINTNPLAIFQNPKSSANQLSEMKGEIDALIVEVEKIKDDEIMVNSGFVYLQQKKIQVALAQLTGGYNQEIFQGLGMYDQVVNKLNKGIGKVRRAIPLDSDLIPDFVKKKVNQSLSPISGNIEIEGIDIPLGSLSGYANAAKALIASLSQLQTMLVDISDPDLEISNNSVINGKVDSPRRKFTVAICEISEIYKEHSDEKFDYDDVVKIQKFLVEYGYLVPTGKKDAINGKYDQPTRKAFQRFMNIVRNAIKYKDEVRTLLDKGVKNPAVARGTEANEVQDLLALAGYLGLKEVDSVYGKDSYQAGLQWEIDWPKYKP